MVIMRVFGSLLMFTAVAAHAQAPLSEIALTGKGELTPQTRAVIQGIGQSVLGAKRSYIADPALQAARAELVALRATLDMAAPKFGVATLKVQGQASIGAAPDNNAEQEKVSQKLYAHLGKLRAQRTQLEAHALDEGADESARSLARGGANKLVELEREIDAAQQANGEERTQRLAHLRERLTPQSQMSLTAPATEPHTPTISTIVEHRR